MTATLSQSQADLASLVEIASRGEDVLITINGQPKAKLTRVDSVNVPLSQHGLELGTWLSELEELRRKYSTGKIGSTIEQILDEDRADRM